MIANRNVLIAFGAVALAQTLVLGWMVADRMSLLRSGREIVLPVIPVDPRSLFRGDYVNLSFAASTLPAPVAAAVGDAKPADTIYVTLEQGADGAWTPVEAARTRPAAPSAANRVVLKAKPLNRWFRFGRSTTQVRYGFESYFVPEGKGRELEQLVRDKQLSVVVAVDRRGNAAIKGLVIDGAVRYEEPLL